MTPLTAEELLQHPEYPHTKWELKAEKEGKVPVAKDRGGPINIAYEVHGHGDRHLVVSSPTFCINTFVPHPTRNNSFQAPRGDLAFDWKAFVTLSSSTNFFW
jgi:hypothetical protein